ncbi:MAG: transporter substrate-binding domain-containing protein, partial [Desulfobacterales bacterium]
QQATSGTSASPVLDRIQQSGQLVVGTMGNMPPLNMTSKDGEIFGLEADLARMLAEAMDVNVKFVTKPFNELLPALQTGQVDMVLSGMTITPERNRKVAFIGPYFISGKAFLTKMKTIADADEAADANNPNTKIVALKGSTSQAFAEAFLDKTTLFAAENYDEAVDMILQDKADAMIADYPICIVSVFRYPDAGLLSVVTQLTYEPIGIAIPANDPLLMNWTRNTLNNIEGSGMLDELKLKWFAEGDWLNKLK